jgi:hypothetical protein
MNSHGADWYTFDELREIFSHLDRPSSGMVRVTWTVEDKRTLTARDTRGRAVLPERLKGSGERRAGVVG